ncbi:MAG TPA: DUF4233 domain-containing protein [Nocardioides sp.]|nr:DUF4233 domain-containing protein [Nocardioides sp.]
MRSVRRSMCAGMLALQAVVLFLAGIVMTGVTDLGFAASLGIGLGLALLCLVAAGMLSRPGGYALGWVVQVVSIGLGFVVTLMFFLGAVFAGLWAAAYFLGTKIDREKAERGAPSEAG